MRGRGLKLPFPRKIALALPVAPNAGAWIETRRRGEEIDSSGVAPNAGAWIETSRPATCRTPGPVAPNAGAWIETVGMYYGNDSGGDVAPNAGAWIETISP